jgi:hypothetical protein
MRLTHAEPGGQWIVTAAEAPQLPDNAGIVMFLDGHGHAVRRPPLQMKDGDRWLGPPECAGHLQPGAIYAVVWPKLVHLHLGGWFERTEGAA